MFLKPKFSEAICQLCVVGLIIRRKLPERDVTWRDALL